MKVLGQYGYLPVVSVGIAILAVVALGCSSESPTKTPLSERGAALPSQGPYGAVQHVDESNFEQLVLQAKGPVLVDFYADWCPPCRALAPTLEELARDVPHVLIVKVDVDRNPNLAAQYGVSGIPSLRVFREGQVDGNLEGNVSKAALVSLLGLDAATSL